MALMIGLVSLLNAIGFGLVVYSFRASRKDVGAATWWFLVSFSILAFAIISRGLYWDVMMPLFRQFAPDSAAGWSELSGGRFANLFFGLVRLAAIPCALKCRQMLLPPEERTFWPWWLVWLHPRAFGPFWR